jgi:small subunit ribosomal protein S18
LADYDNANAEREMPSGSAPSAERSDRDGGDRGRGGRPYQRRDNRRRPKVCQFCVEKAKAVDYKDTALLRQYVTDSGRMLSRRKTGACAKHQRLLSQAIKRARHMALLPYTAEHARLLNS